ncbi:conserved domain protein [Yersinia pestis KIM D27]|nr:conserved domain protein [Yersinia pestis KIM D27]
MILAVGYSLLSLVPYVLIYQLIANFLYHPSAATSQLWWLVGMAVLALAGKAILQLASGLLSHQAAFQLLFELRRQVIERVGRLPLSVSHQHTTAKLKKSFLMILGVLKPLWLTIYPIWRRQLSRLLLPPFYCFSLIGVWRWWR